MLSNDGIDVSFIGVVLLFKYVLPRKEACTGFSLEDGIFKSCLFNSKPSKPNPPILS